MDNKHTVFGQLVGGMDTLTAMERIEVDNKDKPIEDIIFQRAVIFIDPFQEADDEVCFVFDCSSFVIPQWLLIVYRFS